MDVLASPLVPVNHLEVKVRLAARVAFRSLNFHRIVAVRYGVATCGLVQLLKIEVLCGELFCL
jgi:hypothetical protein